MRVLFSLLCLMAAATQAFASDAPPSEASIRRLLTVTESKKLLDNVGDSMDASMDNAMKAALAGQPMNEQAQKILNEMKTQLLAVMKEALAWQDLEPLFIDVYKRSLTQSEVDGMIKFYESDAGKAVVRKMPLVMQNTMQLMQERMKSIMPKIVQIQQEAIAKTKAAAAANSSGGVGGGAPSPTQ